MYGSDLEKMMGEREELLIRDYDAALDLAGFGEGDVVLDVATGTGRMLLQILKRGCSVVSGDIDVEALDRARERLGDLAGKPVLEVMDAHKLPFDDASFEAVTVANAIHELDDAPGALDEVRRVLTPGGKLLITEFNSTGFELMDLHHRMQGKGEHRRGEMTTEQIDAYLRSSFEHVESREFGLVHAWVASGKMER